MSEYTRFKTKVWEQTLKLMRKLRIEMESLDEKQPECDRLELDKKIEKTNSKFLLLTKEENEVIRIKYESAYDRILTNDEVAAQLHITEKTVRNRIKRAKEKLK